MTADSLYVIQGLWIGGALSTAEKLCIRSFQHHGHEFHLYVYDKVDGIPSGTIVKDASTIVSAERIFRYKDNGSVAGFANLFRYALLLANGGAWADLDMVCLRPIPKQLSPIVPLQSYRKGPEHWRIGHLKDSIRAIASPTLQLKLGLSTCNNCFLAGPVGWPLMKMCLDAAEQANPETLKWGDTGPILVTRMMRESGDYSGLAKPMDYCPIEFWNWSDFLSESSSLSPRLDSAFACHLWNEMWRRGGADKNAKAPNTSIYSRLQTQYF